MADTNQPILQLDAPGFGRDTLAYERGKLHAVELLAREHLSKPYSLEVTADTTQETISPERLLLQPVSLKVRRGPAQRDRFFHGIVSELTPQGFIWRDRFRYTLKVVPRLWFLDQITDCRIYQNMTVRQILQSIVDEFQVGTTIFNLNGTLPVREYTTQYNETYLRFMSRIMQEDGLFYFFEHTEQDHKLIIANHNKAFTTIPGPVHRVTGDHRMEQEVVDDWKQTFRTTYGRMELQDYDLQQPEQPLTGQDEASHAKDRPTKGWTAYAWPACTDKNDVVRDRAQTRMQASEAAAVSRSGTATNPTLLPGGIITVMLDPLTTRENVQYVVYSTCHRVLDETWIEGKPPPHWGSEFTCFLEQDTWRDELTLPRPAMTGIYSATVIGDEKEIETDRYGRIKVRPIFEHRHEMKASQAIWVRVLHAWSGTPSGASRGWQHIPRIGTEVGLAFMNGDPDDPVVVGCFYNATATPPFVLPGEKTRQGFRSHSSLDPGSTDYNELSFEDAAGREQVYLRAQKDHVVDVLHDRTVTTVRDDTLTSDTGDISITALEGAISVTAARSITLTVGGSSIRITPELIQLLTAGAISAEAAGAVTINAAGDVEIAAVGAMELTAVGEMLITGGNTTITSVESGVVELLEGFV